MGSRCNGNSEERLIQENGGGGSGRGELMVKGTQVASRDRPLLAFFLFLFFSLCVY